MVFGYAMIARFWFNNEDGDLQMDVINLISKTEGLPDAPISAPGEFFQPASMYYANGLVIVH
jgi:alpha-glucosidase